MHDLVSVPSFNTEKTYEYILSIQVSLNGFSFCIKTQDEEILACKLVHQKISGNSVINHHFSEWIKTEDLLQRTYKKVRIAISSEYFTLIPEAYYDESLKDRIPGLLFQRNSNFEMAENLVHSLKAKLLFALPPGINETIQKEIGECEIAHPVKLLINNLPEIQKDYGLILYPDSDNFYIVLFDKNSVLMANNFKMAHANDIVYYAMNVLKQHDVSLKHTSVFLTGTLNPINDDMESLKPVFPELIALDKESDFNGNKQTIPFVHHCK